jgi:signal transduction histidine kinase
MAVILCWLGNAEASGPIKSIREVRALERAVAYQAPPVDLVATVLYADPVKDEAMIDDGTASCYLRLFKEGPDLTPGDRISIRGNAFQFGLFPHVETHDCRIIGRGPLPEPYRPTVDELFLPGLDSDWVELPAVVIGVDSGGLGYTLVVEVFGHEMRAVLPMVPGADQRTAELMQREVRLTGVVATIFNNDMQMAGRHFFVPSFDHLVPVTDPIDPENAPLTTTLQLLTGNAGQETLVRLEGVVTQENENGFYLRDQAGSAYVRTSMMGRFPRGSVVVAVGFGHMAPYRPVLRAASVIRTGSEPPPEPKSFAAARQNLSSAHDEFIRLRAEFIGLRKGRNEDLLWCREEGDFFEAVVSPDDDEILKILVPGDMLELTGICKLTTSQTMPRAEWADGFRIELARRDGIRVLREAPWWTPRRLMTALGVTGAVCLVAMAGVVLLRRQVAAQLKVIGNKLSVEAVHTERDRMARELHDTLEQQLAGVSLQIDGIARASKSNPEAVESRVAVARRMIRHTRAEARRSVWDLRSRILENEGLPAALRAMAAGVSGTPGSPAVEVAVGENLPPLTKSAEFHLLRLAQEALTNAMKHSGAGKVLIELLAADSSITLRITDDGMGFDSRSQSPEPAHFGMTGMHERAQRIKANIDIESSRGKGCIVTVTVPRDQEEDPDIS